MPVRGQRRPSLEALMNFAPFRSIFHAESTGNWSPAASAFSTPTKISGRSLPLSLQKLEKAGDFLECAGNAFASRTSPLRSTSVRYSAPQISQLIDDSWSDVSSAPRCFRPNERYLASVTTIRSFDDRWPIKALGMSAPHFTFLNSSATAACPHANQTDASSHVTFLMSALVRSRSRLWRELPRQDDGGRDHEQAKPGEGLQHSDEAAALIEPGDQADGGTRCGEADEIAHRIGARAPF